MASVYPISTIQNTVSTIQTTNNHSQLLTEIDYSAKRKWTYLLANEIRFSGKQAHSIRLPKPEHTKLNAWVEKIVASGQCGRLFIEQLSVDEVSFKRIKQLCIDNNVMLVNLLQQQDIQNNVVQGPW